ncbi:S8 family serine peptidase [Patescibacteria group bacterium]|nr:S8 family serine peptidase [Patescibacteria group bacterium]
MYIAGFGGGWRIEKRSLFDGTLDPNFDSDGVVTTGDGTYQARSISIDSYYMYVAGYYNNDQNWRIEKRRLSDGSLCSDAAPCDGVGFGYDCSSGTCTYTGNGEILGENTTHYLSDIAIDESYMYLTGHDGTDATSDWRIEKRLLSNGQLCTAGACGPDPDFGDGGSGVIISEERSPGAGNPRVAIVIDKTHMYLAGDHVSQDWRIEKRLLSDGTLDSTFGSGGVTVGSAGSHLAKEITLDDNNIYVVGFGDGNTPNMRIEKYILTDGTPDTSFGTGGVIEGDNTNVGKARGTALAIDNNNIYVVFEDINNDWRFETYLKLDGTPDSNFGVGGIIINTNDTLTPYGMIIDGSYMYVVGETIGPNFNWRIEKRQLTTGILGNAGNVHGWDFVDCDGLDGGVCVSSPRLPDNNPMDDRGHGTHVAGTIAAQYTNNTGVASMCPHCTIMPVKALNVQGKGLSVWLADSIIFAADHGADIINMSWYGYFSDQLVSDALDYAHSLGLVLVAASGNDMVDVVRFGGVLPGNHENVISVGSLNKEPGADWERSGFSNWGRKIDAAAPGDDILSTVPITSSDPPLASEPWYGHTSGYKVLPGTSMASPHVAGLAALLLAYDPSMTNTMVKGRIMSNTDDIPVPQFKTLKHGVINPYNTLTAPDKSHTLYFEHTIDDSVIDDDDGTEVSANGKIEPGETVDIILTLKNYGLADATDVSAAIYSNDPCVTFINSFSTYSVIPHNQITDNFSNPFQLSYGADCPVTNLKFDFNIFTGNTILETAVIDPAPKSEGIASSNNSIFYTEYWINPSTFNRCDANLTNCEVLLSKPSIQQYYNVGVDKPTGDLLLSYVGDMNPSWPARELRRYAWDMNLDDDPLEVWDDIGYLLDAVGNKNGDLVVMSAFRYVSVFEDRSNVHVEQSSPWRPSAPFGTATYTVDLRDPTFGDGIQGIATDDQNNIYVADAAADLIRKYDQDLNPISTFSIVDPYGVHVEGGIVYVTTNQHQLITLDKELTQPVNVFGVSGVAGNDFTHLNIPRDVTVIGNNIYISDYDNDRILQLTTDWAWDNGDFLGVYPHIIPTLGNWPITAAVAGATDSWSTPLLVNLDADAALEIIITVKDNVYAFYQNGSTVPGWPLSVNGFTSAAMPITGSFDDDPEPEIVFGTMIWTGGGDDENMLYVVNHNGSDVSGWPIPLPGDISHAAAVGDIDNDGFDDIVVGIGSIDGATNKVMAFDKNGDILAGWDDKTLDANTFISDKSPIIADLNQDGNNEVILAGNGQVYIWNGDGSDYGACTISPPADNNILTAAAVANIAGDDKLEIVFGSTNGLMYALNDNCIAVSGWPVNHPSLGPETPVIGDLDNDGDMEIVMPTPLINGINAWHHDGSVVSGWPVSAAHVYKISLADLNGDDTQEILAGTNPSLSNIVDNAFLEAWYHNGVPVVGFPIPGIYNNGVTQPVVGDITQDGTMEIVTGEYLSDADNEVHIFRYNPPNAVALRALEWPTFQNTTGLEGSYFNRCSDGTIYGQCNVSQQYCDSGSLTNNCQQCGYTCPTNYTCTLSGACSYNSGGGDDGSCFLPGTPIQLPNNQSKPIEEIQVGDIVVAYDEATNSFKEAAVLNFFEHEADNYLIINDNLKVTPNHEVYSNGAWVEIGVLGIGDTLLNNQGEPVTINTINIVDEQVTVYNLEVDTYHTYVAGGIVVHNKAQPRPPKKSR